MRINFLLLPHKHLLSTSVSDWSSWSSGLCLHDMLPSQVDSLSSSGLSGLNNGTCPFLTGLKQEVVDDLAAGPLSDRISEIIKDGLGAVWGTRGGGGRGRE